MLFATTTTAATTHTRNEYISKSAEERKAIAMPNFQWHWPFSFINLLELYGVFSVVTKWLWNHFRFTIQFVMRIQKKIFLFLIFHRFLGKSADHVIERWLIFSVVRSALHCWLISVFLSASSALFDSFFSIQTTNYESFHGLRHLFIYRTSPYNCTLIRRKDESKLSFKLI